MYNRDRLISDDQLDDDEEFKHQKGLLGLAEKVQLQAKSTTSPQKIVEMQDDGKVDIEQLYQSLLDKRMNQGSYGYPTTIKEVNMQSKGKDLSQYKQFLRFD